MKTINAVGYSCPQPVLMVKKEFKAGEGLTVLVDNMAAVQNITRFAENKGRKVSHSGDSEQYTVVIEA